jgi:predicted NBD/HSP70 family sugar kinase
MSRSAIGECVAGLLADEVIVETADAASSGGRGRPAASLQLRAVDLLAVAIDLGHAHVTAACGTGAGEVLAEYSLDLDVDHQPQQALDAAATLAKRALRRAGHRLEAVTVIAAGIPGPLDRRARLVTAPTILSDWVGLDPAAELEKRLGAPVVIGNDADMGAQGERAFGAARGIDDFLYVKCSHGIGAGLVLDGRSYRGSTGIAGEIGHTQIPGATSWCRCGSRGCLETVVSIGTVRDQLTHILPASGSALAPDGLPALDALTHDDSAVRVFADAGRTIGRVVADLVNCLNPAAVVLGGELAVAGAPFVVGVRESVDRYAQSASAAATQVLTGQLGGRAELLGSLATAMQVGRTGAAGWDPAYGRW